MTTALIGLLVVLLTAMLAVAGLLIVHRLVPLSIRESHTAAIGIIYAALYVMFGMMVGFSVSAYIVLNKVQHVPEYGKERSQQRRGTLLARRTTIRTEAR